MRHIAFALFTILSILSGVLFFGSCRTTHHTERTTAIPKTENNYTLILFYDRNIGSKPLLKAVRNYKATVLYLYRNFNGIAISVSSAVPEEEAIRYFKQIRGVLSVQKDRKMQLYNNTYQ